MEKAVNTLETLYLGGAVAAFVIFALTLAFANATSHTRP